MKKLFKLISNASKIFNYANVFAVSINGLSVLQAALNAVIEEVKKINPDFKYLKTLESAKEFIEILTGAVEGFVSIFGITAPENVDLAAQVKTDESKNLFPVEISRINEDMKKLLGK